MFVEERIRGRLLINQPAGHVEPGETLLAAVCRETLEETAWTFLPESMVGVYLWGRGAGQRTFLRVAFSGTCGQHDERRVLDTGIERVIWLSRDELIARTSQLRSPMVLRAIDDYLAGIRYPVDLIHDIEPAQLMKRAALLA
ncbi:MAG: NUDIX hydrolase [Gammaproteobacteria bacterium]|nr:NUDIX hydrolase [Gammaproteobacteria bacterium]